MPLIHSKSDAAFKTNLKNLMGERGVSPHVKDAKQALAIAYATKRRGRADGGPADQAPQPTLQITPQIANRFQQRLQNANGDDALTKVVNDAAKYGVDWSHMLNRAKGGRTRRAVGGNTFPSFKPPSSNPSFAVRGEAHNMMHTGPILSAVPGRTDNHAMAVPSGSYVIPAESISHLGQSNTLAGMKVANNMFGPMGPYGAGADMKMGRGMGIPKPPHAASLSDVGGARGKGDGSPVDVLTAGGEYIVRPEIVARIGGGNLKHGHEILDKWIMALRKDHIKTLKHLKPPAKS